MRNGTLPVGMEGHPQTPDDYVQSLALTSGLPHSLIRMGMKKKYGADVAQQIEQRSEAGGYHEDYRKLLEQKDVDYVVMKRMR